MKSIKVAFLSMEIMMPELSEPNCGGNFKGGLGILAGDIMSGWGEFKNEVDCIAFTPLYHRPWIRKDSVLNYDNNESELVKSITIVIDGTLYSIDMRKISRNGQSVYGLHCPEIFDVLYTENRHQRLKQEVAIARAVVVALKELNFRPDIIHLNESHTGLILPQICEDDFFRNTKSLFTIHTPEDAGMERFHEYRFEGLGIDREKYGHIFIKHGILDLTWGTMLMADAVNAVSQEHREITVSKNYMGKDMFPQFRSKISGITNGSDRNFWVSPGLCEDGSNLMENHAVSRIKNISLIAKKSGTELDPNKPVAELVRRLAQYKAMYPLLRPILSAICADRNTAVNTEFGSLQGLGMQVVVAGIAPDTDNECLGWMSGFGQLSRYELQGKFVYIPEYNLELLLAGARGCDIWLEIPEPRREACGTSGQRALMNGVPLIASNTGGPKEYLVEDIDCKEGCGYFLNPHNPLTLYEKLRNFSWLWYDWREKQTGPYQSLKQNAFRVGKSLHTKMMLSKYIEIFKKLI